MMRAFVSANVEVVAAAGRGGAQSRSSRSQVPCAPSQAATRSSATIAACGPCGPRSRHQSRLRTVRVYAIGFMQDGGGNDSRVERRAEAALRDIASLLVFQSTMNGAPALAFKKVLNALRTGKDDGLGALTAYGEYFSLLAAGGYPGWMDYVLDQIFQGNNAFAETLAKGNSPTAALRLAASADLDTLQRLCIAETTLAKWVGDSSGVHEEWLKASAAFKDSYKASDAVREAAASVVQAVVAASGGAGLISAPVISAERAEWRKRLGERWRWSEGGVEDLVAYYRRAGVGAVAESSVLAWREGKLVPAQAPHLTNTLLSCHAEQYDVLHANTQRHMSALPAQHVMLHGQPGCGKSHLLWSAAAACFNSGMRVIVVSKPELRNVGALAAQIANHPRVRFIVVCEDMGVLAFQDVWAELVSLLGSSNWPSNALLYTTALRQDGLRPGATATEALSGGAALKGQFGIRLEIPALTPDEFLQCVQELRTAVSAGVLKPSEAEPEPSAEDPDEPLGSSQRGPPFRTALLDKAARATAEAWDGTSAWISDAEGLSQEDAEPVAWAIERGCGLCVMSAVQYVEEEALIAYSTSNSNN